MRAGVEIDPIQRTGKPLLYFAAERAAAPTVRFLLEHGATADVRVSEAECCRRETSTVSIDLHPGARGC